MTGSNTENIWYCNELINEIPKHNGKSMFDYFEVIELKEHKRLLCEQRKHLKEAVDRAIGKSPLRARIIIEGQTFPTWCITIQELETNLKKEFDKVFK